MSRLVITKKGLVYFRKLDYEGDSTLDQKFAYYLGEALDWVDQNKDNEGIEELAKRRRKYLEESGSSGVFSLEPFKEPDPKSDAEDFLAFKNALKWLLKYNFIAEEGGIASKLNLRK